MTFDKNTQIIPQGADDDALRVAADAIRRGGLVAFPTETVYGLGANAYDEAAVYNIFEAKGRPHDNPLIVHVANPREAENFAYTTELYYKTAEKFMPGPITLILKKRDNIPAEVTAGGDTVGVRCPSHPTANRFLALSGVPVAAPSANLSGRPSPTIAAHCIEDMTGRADVIIDGGECEFGLESTVALLSGETPDNGSIKILRPGAVTEDALRCVCADVTVADGLKPGEIPLSPGMKYKHYAPRAPLILLDGCRLDVINYVGSEMKRTGGKCLFICFDGDGDSFGSDAVLSLGAADDTGAHAHKLFAALRDSDTIGMSRQIDFIYTYMPDMSGDGLAPAIYNRLIRAANHTIKKV